MSAGMPNIMMEPFHNLGAASTIGNVNETTAETFGDFDLTIRGPLDEVGQLWLWADGNDYNDWIDFS